ncbi:hypothetical protein Pse7367_3277 [Thalassoporum mexicanum PCC 7367]|uniref:hypothetical protein n=1 Tax=Thalassoporum mexicanum TaxID=3457544 RepID=UPI00029FF407|nr:hypothetical protein [Pseudanabaena sp. PCC 7367]AFY71518.1 hypothetical protein Pse7367_3277 [Pseudanabaena sp. PCC 7367]
MDRLYITSGILLKPSNKKDINHLIKLHIYMSYKLLLMIYLGSETKIISLQAVDILDEKEFLGLDMGKLFSC